ncbi:alpha-glucan water dikinase 2 [Rosa sericea]
MTSGLLERELDSGSSEPSPEEEDEEDKEADDVESESRIKRRRGDNLESVEETNGSTLQVLSEQNPEASAMEDMCAHPGSFGKLCFLCGQRLIEQSGVTFGYILKRGKIIRQKFVHDYQTLVTEYCRNLQRVKGLGETLVGAYPGRAMSFITQKANLNSPIVNCHPSKPIGLYTKQSVIFRTDSNAKVLEGYAGAGLHDSVIMDKEEKIVWDYSSDRMIFDRGFQVSLFSRIADVGKILEGLYGCPQDIEGVVKDGLIYVVQSRPQI